MRSKVKVNVNPPANALSGSHERTIEVSFPSGNGCLVTLRELDDGTCVVEVYRADKAVEVYASAPAKTF
jgi:hypothetical protein